MSADVDACGRGWTWVDAVASGSCAGERRACRREAGLVGGSRADDRRSDRERGAFRPHIMTQFFCVDGNGERKATEQPRQQALARRLGPSAHPRAKTDRKQVEDHLEGEKVFAVGVVRRARRRAAWDPPTTS